METLTSNNTALPLQLRCKHCLKPTNNFTESVFITELRFENNKLIQNASIISNAKSIKEASEN